MNKIVKGREEDREEAAGDTEDGGDGVRNRRRDLLGAGLHVLARPARVDSRQLVGASQLLDRCRQVLQEVAHAPHHGGQEEEAR